MNWQKNLKLDDIFQRYYEELKAYVLSQVDVKDDAGDIVHDTYLRLRRIDDWGKIQNSKAFIYRAARNLMIDRVRRFSKQVSNDSESGKDVAEQTLQDRRSPLEETLGVEKQRIIQEQISSLPEKCQEVFILHKFSGLKHAEIAAKLNISQSTVEKHIIKALRECRTAIKNYQKS
ncbi:MAG: RNA polymerase sigma factor [Lentisphaerales bacterium]|nr:RNA polymerase sigma factor [Lentisphaerales bacterium]